MCICRPRSRRFFNLARAGINAFDLLECDAEFIFVSAGGDFRVRVGVHVRVHAHGDGRDFFQPRGDAIDALQFRLALGIERINTLPQGEFNFGLRFADAGEDALARVAARRDDALQFAAADDVEAAAEIRQRAQYGQIGIGFDGETDEVIHRRHGRIEFLEMLGQRALRINVKRRAEFAARATQPRRLRKKPFANITKIVHDV